MYERVLMHLRKSRADIEAEARGEGETLAKHEKFLFKFARENSINIIEVRRELESGESLLHRPEMQQTLREVEQGLYDGVLVMDIDRLGRGNMQDQGIILDTFKKSNTKIITPRKVYDLNDEWDEEYSEFEAFMARKELKYINRRLQRGRVTSVEEGNYIGTRPPYGWLIEKNGKKDRYLVPHPEQGPVVKMIFDWYTNDDPEVRIGSSKIANDLNQLGYKSYTGKPWDPSSVLNTIKNPVHAGYIVWKKKEIKKSTTPGKKKDTRTRPKDEWIVVKGKHEPLVSEDVFWKAQEILKGKYHVPYQLENGITNPLAGLVRCDICGASMIYRPYSHQRYPHIMCYNRRCANKSSRFEYVEQKVLEGLRVWLSQYKAQWSKRKRAKVTDTAFAFIEEAVKKLEKELADLEIQKNNLHDLLEQKVYDINTYLERSQVIAERIEKARSSLTEAKKSMVDERARLKAHQDIIPHVEHVLDMYNKTEDPAQKNNLLKTVLEFATYRKEKHQRDDNFTLVLHPRLPKSNDLHR